MKKIFTILFAASMFVACNKEPANDTSKFQGEWTGTYTSSGENGTFKIVVDGYGQVTGSSSSQVFSETFQLVGVVNPNGNLALAFGAANSGGTFTGIMNNNSASGTWENKMTTPIYSGTWTGNKQ